MYRGIVHELLANNYTLLNNMNGWSCIQAMQIGYPFWGKFYKNERKLSPKRGIWCGKHILIGYWVMFCHPQLLVVYIQSNIYNQSNIISSAYKHFLIRLEFVTWLLTKSITKDHTLVQQSQRHHWLESTNCLVTLCRKGVQINAKYQPFDLWVNLFENWKASWALALRQGLSDD